MNFLKSKWFKIPYYALLYGFAAYGFFLTATYFAMKFRWTNTGGQIDVNNRYFQDMADKYNQGFKTDSVSMEQHKKEVLTRIGLLSSYYPKNAEYVLHAYQKTGDVRTALQMLDVVDLKLREDESYQSERKQLNKRLAAKGEISNLSVFDWMNVIEWSYFKEALAKDKKWIDSAAHVSGVESRTIVAALVGEQVRLFNSRRERFKNYVAPLKSLALETNASYGVTGIKENTAKKIEYYLKDKKSPFYLGEQYEHILDYDTTAQLNNSINDSMHVRLKRLVQFSNHYYSFLYAGLFIKQIRTQWLKAGYNIDNRPEIFATLFNLGYHKSIPNKFPEVGGSIFKINDKEYTFGGVAFEFYYSGEMLDAFPYVKKKFYTPKTYYNKHAVGNIDAYLKSDSLEKKQSKPIGDSLIPAGNTVPPKVGK